MSAYENAETGVSFIFAEGVEVSVPNPKHRPSREEKGADKEAVAAEKEKMEVATTQKAAAAKAAADVAYAHEVTRCGDCNKAFLSGNSLASHKASI